MPIDSEGRDTAAAPHTAAPVAEQLAFDDWWANVRRAEDAHQAAEEAWIYRGSIAPAADRAELAAEDMEHLRNLVNNTSVCPAESCAVSRAIDAMARSTDAPSGLSIRESSEERKERQRREWVAAGGFFQRFNGADHACIPLVAWRALSTSPTAQGTDAPSEPVAWQARGAPDMPWRFCESRETYENLRDRGYEVRALVALATPPAAATAITREWCVNAAQGELASGVEEIGAGMPATSTPCASGEGEAFFRDFAQLVSESGDHMPESFRRGMVKLAARVPGITRALAATQAPPAGMRDALHEVTRLLRSVVGAAVFSPDQCNTVAEAIRGADRALAAPSTRAPEA